MEYLSNGRTTTAYCAYGFTHPVYVLGYAPDYAPNVELASQQYVSKRTLEFIILEVYVEVLPIVGTSKKEILEVIMALQHQSLAKHLGPLQHFLGIHV